MPLAILSLLLGLAGGFLAPSTVAADACEEWVAKVESVQGRVQVRRAGELQWAPVRRRDTFCPGDIIRVQERGRVAIVARNEAVYRLDANTTITITEPEPKQTFLLNLRRGAAYFFSRVPRSLKVITPFLNAGVEGTEFLVKVEGDQTFLSVFEGRVAATNAVGSLTVASGQSAIAKAGQAPAVRVVVRPRDAVQWALHYPPIVDFRPADFPGDAAWQVMLRQSISFYRQGDLPRAFASLREAPQDIRDPRFFTYRAALLLTVGRVDDARVDIESALQLDPRNSHAVALQSIIAVAQNRQDDALQLAQKAVELEPASSAARVALSYARQARFDLRGALASLEAAVQLPSENALAWARLAEIWLSIGDLKKAPEAAQRAVALNPQVARTQTVLGFAFLTQIKIQDAKNAFEKAIDLDQAAPLPRLGLGLTQIRRGKLKAGRGEVEIAASLDPNNSLIRSYLGKAYFEEKRTKLASDQFVTAKTLDPRDPTPWFYDAIRKQTVNRPVEALHDLQKSIELNDNRAVYRSRLLLDEDLAARSASLGRIYNDLGFQQLALVQGWKSLNTDPSDYSAHRFLADLYSALPRHEIARVSELLQSQLLQPVNITPIQPQLTERDLLILEGGGPATLSFNEFNPLFTRNQFTLQASGIAGSNATLGDEIVHSGIWGRLSYSLGQFHFETDGFRENNDLQQDIYNVFIQGRLSHQINIQVEYRREHTTNGDTILRFNPENFSKTFREDTDSDTLRFGLHYSPTIRSDFIASIILQDRDETESSMDPFEPFDAFSISTKLNQKAYDLETQYLFRTQLLNIIAGGGHLDGEETLDIKSEFLTGPITIPGESSKTDSNFRHTNAYVYARLHFPARTIWTIGASGDFFQEARLERNQFNPKVGLIWNLTQSTTLRAAVFRVLKRELIANQTIEPTQVAGFNQFFDDVNGSDSTRYGIAIDQRFSSTLYGGLELTKRDVDEPIIRTNETLKTKRDEQLHRAYLYWTPTTRAALSAEYQFEELDRDIMPDVLDRPNRVRTHRIPLGLNVFHLSGLFMRLQATYIHQEIEFPNTTGGTDADEDQFWVADLSMGYRFPKRWGILNITVKNLFNENFRFQDTDLAGEPRIPSLQPERLIFARLTFSF